MEILEINNPDIKLSKCLNLKYQGITIFNDISKKPMNGEFNVSGDIIRFKNGLLHGGKSPDGNDIPAFETEDGHVEFFENGLLHRENFPAVISDFGDWEEWWNHGNLIYIRTSAKINVETEQTEGK